VVLTAAFFASCADQPTEPESQGVTAAPDAQFAMRGRSQRGCTGCAEDGAYSDALDAINVALEAKGAKVRVFMAEIVSSGDTEAMGQTLFARDVGNKQLGHDFVPNDPRRHPGSNITYVIDGVDGGTSSGPDATATEAAIDRAMATWDAQTCSDLNMTGLGVAPFDIGVVQSILGLGGIGSFFADVSHAGWLPAVFFDAIGPPPPEDPGSTFIVGVTFTFVFVDSDIDNNGKSDVAFREIYYNDAFPWGIDVDEFATMDVETIALHESGHGLSQGHFGKIFRTNANGKLHFSPEAVMNAAVAGQKQTLLGTDIGGHCSNWAEWPNN